MTLTSMCADAAASRIDGPNLRFTGRPVHSQILLLATPLSRAVRVGPEALRPRLSTGLPFSTANFLRRCFTTVVHDDDRFTGANLAEN